MSEQPVPEKSGRTTEPLRVLFAGGGTGGHLMPGLATIRTLDRLVPEAEPVLLATERDGEMGYSDSLKGIRAESMPAARWTGAANAPRFAGRSAAALCSTVGVFRRFHPDVVVGLGGYSCVGPVVVARLLRVPSMLFEANALPGRAVRLLGPRVDGVQAQWPGMDEKLPGTNIMQGGLPVRRRIFDGSRVEAINRFELDPDRFTLLVMGGSQGASGLNRMAVAALADLAPRRAEKLQVLHLAGPHKLDDARGHEMPLDLMYRSRGYLSEIEDAYAAADMVLCRAGGSSLAEITALGLPAVLVPYPAAADDHQRANADVLAQADAAVLLEEGNGAARELKSIICRALDNPGTFKKMGRRAARAGKPDAARTAVQHICRLGGRAEALPRGQEKSRDTNTLSSAA